MNIDILLQKLAQPAQRAIRNKGILTLEQLASYPEKEVCEWHGIGQNTLEKMKAVLGENGYTFREGRKRTDAMNTIDEYIAQFPPEVQEKLAAVRNTIREAAPEATEKISWQMPTFYLHGNLVHFAAMKKHIGFYPGPSGVAAFAPKLTEYKTSKGAIQFPLNKPLPLDLIREIVTFRVAENKKTAEEKKKK